VKKKRLRTIGLVAAAVVALGATIAVVAAKRAGPSRPNVLLLVMDTTRADRCSIDGYERPTTPRLAEFAKDATLFRDAWSPSNWTGPAHATLFTGLRPEHHGFHKGAREYLTDGADTIAKRLASLGYATGCFSNNAAVSPEFGLVQGFDTFVPYWERRVRTPPWARQTHEEAAAWARTQARDGTPFFLFINDMEAHLPYVPPAEVAARFVRGSPSADAVEGARRFGYPQFLGYDIGAVDLTNDQLGLISDLYDAEVATLDEEIGGLLDALRADGVLDDTLVVVTADHGENLGDHHLCEHSFGMNRTLLHVPLVMRFPGKFDKGRVVDDVVRLEDLYPTVLEVCGASLPPDLDGVSLMRGLGGRSATGRQYARQEYGTRIKEFFPGGDTTKLLRQISSAYDGRHHLLRYSDGTEELFDTREDPGELRDVLASSPDPAAKLRALIPEVPR